MSSSVPSCLGIYLQTCLPASLAPIYAISVLAFRAIWHECSWTSMNTPILLGSGLLGAAIASSIGFCHAAAAAAATATTTSKQHEETQLSMSNHFASLAFGILSIVLMIHTYNHYVQGPKPNCKPNCMKDKVVLITGANAGIGKETARQLLQLGATVILACRSEKRALQAMHDLLPQTSTDNDEDRKKRMLFLELDVSNLKSVRNAATKFKNMNLPLHVLINNAGIMMGTREESVDGYELTMACNHLGHFLFTTLLLDTLRENSGCGGGGGGASSRVVNVTSTTYTLAKGGIDLDDLLCERRSYSLFSQYAQSKLANILFSIELARKEQQHQLSSSSSSSSKQIKTAPIATYSVHPGLVRTDVVRNMPWYLKYPNMAFGFVLCVLQKTPQAGGYTSVYCAASDEVEGQSGFYYVNSEVVALEDFARDPLAASKLWELSEKLVDK